MKHDQVQFKMIYGKIAELCRAYEWLNKNLVGENDHDLLLADHAKEFEDYLQKKLALENNSYTLTLCTSQARAFQQLWKQLAAAGVEIPGYPAEILRTVMTSLDKVSNTQKILRHAKRI